MARAAASSRTTANLPAGNRYKVEAVSRAVLVLEALRRSRGAATALELAARTGCSIRAVEGVLDTLERRRLIQRSDDGPSRYKLGLAWLRLGDVKRQQLNIREIAVPVMRRVRDAVNETVSLGIRIGANRVNIEYAESLHEVRRITQPGFHVPLHVGAGGRVMLSGFSDSEIAAYLAALPGRSQSGKPLPWHRKFMAEVREARSKGYAMIAGEVTGDTAAVSAPITDQLGDVVAVLSISAPEARLMGQAQAGCIREVIRGARGISLALGSDPAR